MQHWSRGRLQSIYSDHFLILWQINFISRIILIQHCKHPETMINETSSWICNSANAFRSVSLDQINSAICLARCWKCMQFLLSIAEVDTSRCSLLHGSWSFPKDTNISMLSSVNTKHSSNILAVQLEQHSFLYYPTMTPAAEHTETTIFQRNATSMRQNLHFRSHYVAPARLNVDEFRKDMASFRKSMIKLLRTGEHEKKEGWVSKV